MYSYYVCTLQAASDPSASDVLAPSRFRQTCLVWTASNIDWVQHDSGQCTSSYLIRQNDHLRNVAVRFLGITEYSQLLANNPWTEDPNATVTGTHLPDHSTLQH